MAAKINWHRYGTKLRHCQSMYIYSPAVDKTAAARRMKRQRWQTRRTMVPLMLAFRATTELIAVRTSAPVASRMLTATLHIAADRRQLTPL